MPSILLNRKKSSGYNGKNRSNNSRKDKQQQSESSSIRSLEKLLDCSSSNNEARVQCFCGDSYDGGVGRHLGSEIVKYGIQSRDSKAARFWRNTRTGPTTLHRTFLCQNGLVKKKLCNRKPLKVVPLMMYLGENFVSAFN
ncbi:unnamed protein product [Rhizophagus irregularis]|nr:unnamed protein product [Rhizophagus irregularis]